jgi:hypothetical protein
MVAGRRGCVYRLAVAVAAALLLCACGGGGGTSGPTANPPSSPPAPPPPPVVPPVVTPPPPPSLPETVLSFDGTLQEDPAPVVPAVKSKLLVTAIAFDATRNQLIAGAILKNNTTAVVGLNPVDLSAIWTFATTSPATVLAVSDDGSMLYAGLFFESSIQQIDLAAHASVRTFAVADSGSGLGAFDLSVRPGSPNTVAAAIGSVILIPTSGLPFLFVQGVKQPTAGFPHDDRSSRVAFLDASTLITLDNETTANDLQKFSVSDNGLTYVSYSPRMCCGSHVRVVNGRIFLSSGVFVDPLLKLIKAVGSDWGDLKLFLPGTNSVVHIFAQGYSGSPTSAQLGIREYDADRGYLKRKFRVDETIPGVDPFYGVAADIIDAVPTGPSSFAVLVADDFTGASALLSYDLSAIAPLQPRTLVAQTSTAANVSAVSIQLPFYSYAYDPSADRIVATVQALMGPQGSSLAVIRPSDGTVERFVPLSSDPREVWVSPSGSIAYVNLPFELAVQQVNVGTGALGPKMNLELPVIGSANQDLPAVPFSPTNISVKPDDPQTFAAVGCAESACGGVSVFRNGVYTGVVGPSPVFSGGCVPLTTKVAFNGPGELLGFDNATSESIQHFSYDASGLHPVSGKCYVLDSSATVGFGYVYSPYSVVDIQSDTKVGTFAPGSTDYTYFAGTLLMSPVSGIGSSAVVGDPVFELLTKAVKPDGSFVFSGQSRIRIHDSRSPLGGGPLLSVGANRFSSGLTRFDNGTGVIYVISTPQE